MSLIPSLTAKRTPFLYFILPLVGGIITAWMVFPFSYFLPMAGLLLFMMAAVVIYFCCKGKDKRKSIVNTAVFIQLFFFGCLLSWWHNDRLRTNYAGNYLTDSSFVKVLLKSPMTEKRKSWKAEAQILAVKNGNQIFSTQGNAFVYFQKSETKPDLKYGDILIFPNKLREIKNAGNPGEFDYERYCRVNNIGYSAYLSNHQWLLIKRKGGNRIRGFFLQLRKKGIQRLNKYISSGRESAVATALLLGYRADLDPELVQAFANVGVVHLLAISGLHVGLIYLILLAMCRLLPRKTKRLRGILICICLWSFALLTGAHPSTLRATLMFSFFVIGRFFFNRRVDPFNILAASAFLLLCIQPYLLFDVGFQLSYLAVAGILAFQKPLSNLFWSRYKAINYLWDMLSVTWSAQILVFPLVLYYFQQFPSFFLLSNLLLLPLATLALYGEVILLLLSFVPEVAHYIGWLLTKVLFFIDETVLWANNIPFVRLSYTQMNFLRLCGVYLIIGLFCIWLLYKYKRAFIYGVAITTLLLVLGVGNQLKHTLKKEIIVYNIRGSSVLELVSGEYSKLFCSEKVLENSSVWKYTLKPTKAALHIEKRTVMQQPAHFFYFGNKSIVWMNRPFSPATFNSSFPVDYIILSHYNSLSMKDLFEVFSPDIVIFDSSVYNWQREKWKSACKKLNLHCFSVTDKGAWSLSL